MQAPPPLRLPLPAAALTTMSDSGYEPSAERGVDPEPAPTTAPAHPGAPMSRSRSAPLARTARTAPAVATPRAEPPTQGES